MYFASVHLTYECAQNVHDQWRRVKVLNWRSALCNYFMVPLERSTFCHWYWTIARQWQKVLNDDIGPLCHMVVVLCALQWLLVSSLYYCNVHIELGILTVILEGWCLYQCLRASDQIWPMRNKSVWEASLCVLKSARLTAFARQMALLWLHTWSVCYDLVLNLHQWSLSLNSQFYATYI